MDISLALKEQTVFLYLVKRISQLMTKYSYNSSAMLNLLVLVIIYWHNAIDQVGLSIFPKRQLGGDIYIQLR